MVHADPMLRVEADRAGEALAGSVRSFVAALASFSEVELMGASRCFGWSRLTVIVHMIAGWQELLGGLAGVTDEPESTDAAAFWRAFAETDDAATDPVARLMSTGRRTYAYATPAAAVQQLEDVADALLAALPAHRSGHRAWAGQVFTVGDLMTTWAVENVIHQADLLAHQPLPAQALGLAVETVQALWSTPAPEQWSAEQIVDIGSGRVSWGGPQHPAVLG
ncbi:maleylpyruvate isomerase N-terminal domain-containing protein [Dermacoccaceae bacterium W4C1]